jgi:hypothetical protein
MVKALHSAGTEVILDVVYNHTAEGNHLGPTLSFRGIDNAAYYRLVACRGERAVYACGTGGRRGATRLSSGWPAAPGTPATISSLRQASAHAVHAWLQAMSASMAAASSPRSRLMSSG